MDDKVIEFKGARHVRTSDNAPPPTMLICECGSSDFELRGVGIVSSGKVACSRCHTIINKCVWLMR